MSFKNNEKKKRKHVSPLSNSTQCFLWKMGDYHKIWASAMIIWILRELKISSILGLFLLKQEILVWQKIHLTDEALKGMYVVLRMGRMYKLSITCLFDLFDKVIKPILLYGCEVWSFSNNDILEKIHLTFCKGPTI
jgi:hypothetical protein